MGTTSFAFLTWANSQHESQNTTCKRRSCSSNFLSPNVNRIYHASTKTKLVLLLLFLLLLLSTLFTLNERICPRQNFFRRIHYINRPGFISPDVFKNCEYACIMTEGWDYSSADVVIWQGMDSPIYPPRKYINQTWVFHSMEPPLLHVHSMKLWDGLFNWTISYRRDSDFYSPYGIFRTVQRNSIPTESADLLNWKTRSDVLWFVSNCHVPSGRPEYAAELDKYVRVDVYGKCGTKNCSGNWESCSKELRNKYKYYLSFENSLCRDYITEKSMKIYESLFNAIPVTRTGANVSLYLPPGSYLSTADASNTESMALYLYKLKSPTSFFRWRQFYVAEDTIDSEQTFCELCRRSHTVNKYRRLYRSLDKWLRGNDGAVPSMCSRVNDLL
ncbi:Alpha-(1,3)-fucosyltransferase C [Mizuhopecten yessoensis]|uniref:Fucosyltransferase n=1 Tax=Mizuhopecten yessoensis TaxID=6573 RepID=A0A210QLX9_MIZYE|nr:Alpha-(1,3)-fucosyltransferase C [Mizuhopecten yessoensis]